MRLSAENLTECLQVLEAIVENRAELATLDAELRTRLLTAAGRVSRPEREQLRQLTRAVRKQKKQRLREQDESLLERAGIRQKRLEPVFVTPDPLSLAAADGGVFECGRPTLLGFDPETSDNVAEEELPSLNKPRACYVCKTLCSHVHAFYDQMCGPCGDFNYEKRSQTADLHGRVALISGARVKIGYQAAIMLLRSGARVLVSTRFPRDAALRYARELDYSDWKDRLQIYGLDLRHTPSVEAFARHLLASEERLDFVIHNACQTVRRPRGFYRHLMDAELGPSSTVPAAARPLLESYESMRSAASRELTDRNTLASPPLAIGLHSAALSQVAVSEQDLQEGQALFPHGKLDANLQQVDLRQVNSWRLPLDQVSTIELLEVQLVNAIAPFVLNARLKPLMLRQRTFDKHIVNVSALEGQFYRRYKTDKHPHTNMAKAALNMMTRTSAADYAKDGIFMNSVDTGWVTDEDPAEIAARKTAENGFHPPLDIVDGAARIVDPILDGINTGRHVWGQFLKDYRPTSW